MRYLVIALLGALLIGGPVSAHHSVAMFDLTKEIRVTGTVVSWQWTNPHSWLYLMVTGPDGKPVKAGLEVGSPNTMIRSGWKQNSFKTGEKITAIMNPRRDGTPGGMLVTARTTSGQWLEWLPRAARAGAIGASAAERKDR